MDSDHDPAPATARCPDCGQPLPDGERIGCPACLFGLASGDPGSDSGSGPEKVARAPLPGLRSRSFGAYEIEDEIARGGMGIVYRARQRGLDRRVALKMLPPGHIPSPEAWERFRTEIATAARLHHPGIVPLYESGEVDGIHYYTMRLMEGGDLAGHLARARSQRAAAGAPADSRAAHVARRERVELVSRVARAVHHAHQRGVLHRDLKPSNILLDEDGTPYVGDFGLAKLLARENAATLTESILGSPNYMAPEQAEGRGADLTVETDVYGLGAILYESLAGHPPFRAPTPLETIRKVVEEPVVRPRQHDPGIDLDLETICLKCLEKEPRARYQSAEDLADDLDRWRDGLPVQARQVSSFTRLARWARRRPTLATLGALVALLTLVGIGGGWAAAVRIRAAERQARNHLRDALLEQARAINRAGLLGGRADSLEALRRAATLGGSPAFRAQLRDEAMIALGQSDVRLVAGPPLTAHRPEWSLVDLPRDRVAQVVAPSEIVLLRLRDATELRRIPLPGASIERLEAFSADGRCLAVRRFDGLTFCDPETGRVLFATNVANRAFSFAPEAARVLLEESEAEPRVATVRDLPSFQVTHRMVVPGVAGDEGLQGWGLFSWSPDGNLLATARHGGTVVECFEVATGKVLWRRQDPVPTTAFAWDPHRKRLFLGAADGPCRQVRWTDGTVLDTFEFPGGSRSLALRRDGSILAAATHDQRVRLLDLASRRVLFETASDSYRIAFDHGSRLATLARAGRVGALEITPSRHLREGILPAATNNAVGSRGFLRDGRTLLLAYRNRLVFWDVDAARSRAELRLGTPVVVAPDPRGEGLLSSDAAGIAWRRWSPTNAARPDESSRRVVVPGTRWSALAYGARGDRIWAVQLASNNVVGFDRAFQPTGIVLGPIASSFAVAASSDGRWVAAGSIRDKLVKVWDAATGAEVASLHAGRQHRIEFSSDSQWLLVHGEIFVLRSTGDWTSEPRLALPEGAGTLGPAAFSHDARRLAVVQDQSSIRLFELPSGASLGRLSHLEPSALVSLDFDPSGNRLSAISARGRWDLWDLAGIETELAAMGIAESRD